MVLATKPGLGAVDVVGGGLAGNVDVVVSSTDGSRESTRNFTVRIDGGARLTLSPAVGDGVMTVSKIGAARGPVIDTTTITAKG
jgi:hypothetical protein